MMHFNLLPEKNFVLKMDNLEIIEWCFRLLAMKKIHKNVTLIECSNNNTERNLVCEASTQAIRMAIRLCRTPTICFVLTHSRNPHWSLVNCKILNIQRMQSCTGRKTCIELDHHNYLINSGCI